MIRDRCRQCGTLYPKNAPVDKNGWRRCVKCREASRARNAAKNRAVRREFSGTANVEAAGDTPTQRQAREAAAYWAYGDRNELRYG